MLERDVLLPEKDESIDHSDLTLSVITPYPMMKWMLQFVEDNIFNRPDLLEIIPSTKLNPEKAYYYQGDYSEYVGIDLDTSLPHGECQPQNKDETIATFVSDDPRV